MIHRPYVELFGNNRGQRLPARTKSCNHIISCRVYDLPKACAIWCAHSIDTVLYFHSRFSNRKRQTGPSCLSSTARGYGNTTFLHRTTSKNFAQLCTYTLPCWFSEPISEGVRGNENGSWHTYVVYRLLPRPYSPRTSGSRNAPTVSDTRGLYAKMIHHSSWRFAHACAWYGPRVSNAIRHASIRTTHPPTLHTHANMSRGIHAPYPSH